MSPFDAVTLEVLWNRLISIVDETGATLQRTSFSTIVRESNDFACVILDPLGRSLAQSVMTNGFDVPIAIHCTVRVQGSEMFVDYAGTSSQIERGINCVMNYTYAYSLFAVKCLTNLLIPNNEGGFRPVHITAQEGCILNPKYPAAVGSRAQMGHFLPAAVFGALAPVIPERVAADSGSPLWGPVFSGSYRGRKFSDIYFFNGGQGARPISDGIHCLSFPSNISNTPLEVFENNVPVRFEEKSLLPDSGGAGRFRGGRGQRVVLSFQAEEPTAVAMRMDRIQFPPQSYHGGQSGATGLILLNEQTPLHPKRKFFLQKGDRVRFHTPGGGGLFTPETRDPQRVLEDVRNGIVSREAAEQIYHVAIKPDRWDVDEARTLGLRG
jgi:N-methylhydantoinase B